MLENILLTLFWTSLVALVYTQIGYPLLMFPFSRRKPVMPVPDTEWPLVSLIIPAYNEQAVLRMKLTNSFAIDYPRERLEVIVASDGSVDETVSIARECASQGVRLMDFQQRRGKASIVTDAVAASRGEIICLCDANVMFKPDALSLLVRHLQDPCIGAASGDVRLASEESDFGSGESVYYRIERALQLGESCVGSMMGVDGGMFVVRRKLFRPLPPDTILDDFVTSMNVIRQQHRIAYEPDAIATENGTPSWRHEFKRRVRVNAGAMQCLKRGQYPPLTMPVEFWQFVSHKLLRWIGPVLLILVLVLSLFFVTSSWIYQTVVASQVALYGTALLAVYSLPLRNSRLGGIAFYFTLSHLAMLVGMVKGLFQQQRGTWDRTERATVDSAESKAVLEESESFRNDRDAVISEQEQRS